jgi:hypothetical protein
MMSEEKKLTDEEIVKELKRYRSSLDDCMWGSVPKLLDDTLDLIHHLQEENKTLKSPKYGRWKVKFFNAQDEIKRLTEERDVAGYKNGTLIFDKSNLQSKNAELQKQVDELKELAKIDLEHERVWGKIKTKQAVKDTAEKFAEMAKEAFNAVSCEFDDRDWYQNMLDEICKEITEGKV